MVVAGWVKPGMLTFHCIVTEAWHFKLHCFLWAEQASPYKIVVLFMLTLC